jgi:hypothetical protein
LGEGDRERMHIQRYMGGRVLLSASESIGIEGTRLMIRKPRNDQGDKHTTPVVTMFFSHCTHAKIAIRQGEKGGNRATADRCARVALYYARRQGRGRAAYMLICNQQLSGHVRATRPWHHIDGNHSQGSVLGTILLPLGIGLCHGQFKYTPNGEGRTNGM